MSPGGREIKDRRRVGDKETRKKSIKGMRRGIIDGLIDIYIYNMGERERAVN